MKNIGDLGNTEFDFKKLFIPLTTFKVIHIIIILGFLVYGNMLFNGFVWDDILPLGSNTANLSINASTIFGPSIFNSQGLYRPLPALYFSVLHSIFGAAPFYYHFLQLLLHISYTIIIYLLFSSFYKRNLSLLLSLLFLVHPIQTESVSYIMGGGHALYILFGLIAILISIRYKLTRRLMCLVSILLLLSLLSKESGLLFYVTILSYILLFKRRNFFFLLMLQGITLLVYAVLRFLLGRVPLVQNSDIPIASLSLFERVLNLPAILTYYIKTVFYPARLSIMQHWVIKEITFNTFYLPLFIALFFFVTIFVCGIFLYRRRTNFKIYTFFTVWFLAGLLLIVQLFPLNMTVADRWFYFPMVGFLGLIGAVMQSYTPKPQWLRVILLSCLVCLIVIYSMRTVVRNTNWIDNLTLYQHDSRISSNYFLENDLGAQYSALNQHDKAIYHYKKAFDMHPCDEALYNIGSSLEFTGDKKRAVEAYRKSFTLPSCKQEMYPEYHRHNLTIYIQVGRFMISSGYYNDAKKYILSGIKDYPNTGLLWAILAVDEYKLNNYDEALRLINKARRLSNDLTVTSIYKKIVNKDNIILE